MTVRVVVFGDPRWFVEAEQQDQHRAIESLHSIAPC